MTFRSVTIRGVPADVHRELAARAAHMGMSLQEYLLAELERYAARPAASDLVEHLRARKASTRTRLPSARIIRHRDADRK